MGPQLSPTEDAYRPRGLERAGEKPGPNHCVILCRHHVELIKLPLYKTRVPVGPFKGLPRRMCACVVFFFRGCKYAAAQSRLDSALTFVLYPDKGKLQAAPPKYNAVIQFWETLFRG